MTTSKKEIGIYSTEAERKEVALQYLNKLQVDEKAITEFKEHNTVCLFTRISCFQIEAGSELDSKIKAIERIHGGTVYAVTNTFLSFGECFEFLIVSPYPEDWGMSLRTHGDMHSANAWVWNRDAEERSEMGYVSLQCVNGKLRRIA